MSLEKSILDSFHKIAKNNFDPLLTVYILDGKEGEVLAIYKKNLEAIEKNICHVEIDLKYKFIARLESK